MDRLDLRAWKDPGMLLYLSQEDAQKLFLFLRELSQFLNDKSRSAECLHAIRMDLSYLLQSLSPLSKTGKVLFELLDRTQALDSLDRKAIYNLINELERIYQISNLKNKVAGLSKKQIGAGDPQ